MNTARSQETCVQRGVKFRRAELPSSGPLRCLKRGGRRLAVVAALVIPAVLAGTAWLGTASRAASRTAPVLDRWEVLARDPARLTLQDLAAVNLACAEALPGAAGFEARSVLRTVDEWAARVRDETARHLPKFRQNPSEYQNSEAYFRMLALVTVLQQDCGVRYNPERVRTPDFSDSRDLFLHGLTQGRGGTCASMPVAYVAVGRRLGYPLRLVTAKAHLFARWESSDGKECLNLEATSQGLNCFPDDYYHRWPVPMTPLEIAGGQYLKSLTPAEELAVFLSARGHCLEASGRLAEAQVAHAHAHALAPLNPVYLAFLAAAVRKELPGWQRVQVDLGQPGPTRPGTKPPSISPSSASPATVTTP